MAEKNGKKSKQVADKKQKDPVRLGAFIILFLVILLLAWHLISDRLTPFTTQARVHALVIPVSAEVSGKVISVSIRDNQKVKKGQELFKVDPDRYQLDVETAEANLQTARQAMGASGENVNVAEASLISAEANLVLAEQDAVRLKLIREEDPGAISIRRLEKADAALKSAKGKVASAKANINKAKEDLGRSGAQNSHILQAQASLDQAELNLEKTIVRAPENGLVTNVLVDNGNYAAAGSPQLTFIAVENIWVQADFTENNLGNIRSGDEVQIVFDVFPGKVFSGIVREIGFGVALDSAPLGSLPTIDNNRDWLRTPQRYPVLLSFELPIESGRTSLRVGSQATAIVYTGDHALFNTLGRFHIWLNSILSYAY